MTQADGLEQPRPSPDSDPLARLRRAVDTIAVLTQARPRTGLSHEDAPPLEGTWASDDAIGFDPFPVLKALDVHGAKVVVIGQVAGIMHGSTELTGDLDLLWDGGVHQAEAMAMAFASLGVALADQESHPLPCDRTAFMLPKVLFRTPSASGDCCTPHLPWGDLDIPGILRRAELAIGENFNVFYATVADLVIMRRAVGRAKDLRRALELEAISVG